MIVITYHDFILKIYGGGFSRWANDFFPRFQVVTKWSCALQHRKCHRGKWPWGQRVKDKGKCGCPQTVPKYPCCKFPKACCFLRRAQRVRRVGSRIYESMVFASESCNPFRKLESFPIMGTKSGAAKSSDDSALLRLSVSDASPLLDARAFEHQEHPRARVALFRPERLCNRSRMTIFQRCTQTVPGIQHVYMMCTFQMFKYLHAL